jgi:hypothetical protein
MAVVRLASRAVQQRPKSRARGHLVHQARLATKLRKQEFPPMDPARPSHALAIILGIGIGWLIRATLQSKTNRWGVACFLLLCGLASLAMVAAEWEP